MDLSPHSLTRALKTQLIGREVIYQPVTTSTMDAARQAIGEGAREGTIVVADRQTAGRGRFDREWIAPAESSILLSIILYPRPEELPRINMAAAIAVARSIEQVTGLRPAIKWPNDVLIGGKKVSGILIEADTAGVRPGYAVVGLAVNVNLETGAIPEIADTATSLKEMLGRGVSRLDVLATLLGEFEALYQALRRGEPIEREWQARMETLGREVSVRCGDEVKEGRAEAVDEDGNLLLRLADGSLVAISAGDVTLHV